MTRLLQNPPKLKPRTYRITDAAYNKAIKKGKGNLSKEINKWVTAFGEGKKIVIHEL